MSYGHRSFGETRNCKGCRYWSEMLAQCRGGGPVEAVCLSPTSPARGKYMAGSRTCADWKSGHLGAVDEPGQDSDAYAGCSGDPKSCPNNEGFGCCVEPQA